MNILGFSIARQKAVAGAYPVVPGSGGWWSIVRESFTGAWQRNVEVRIDSVLTYHAVFTCISLISSDIAKMRIRLVQKDANGIWVEVESNSPFWPVLRKPNRYQTRIQFFANWVESKLIHGNTYVLKERDARGVVTRLYVLDPTRVTLLVAPDGSVFYDLRCDQIAGIPEETIRVPASEIIHDRYATLHHPLVGVSPIHASGVPAMQGLKIQESSTQFFAGGANPSGILIAPTNISIDDAERLRSQWNKAYGPGGERVGTVAVLGNGVQYVPLTMSAVDTDLLNQLKWTAETVCSTFRVPAYMVGIGAAPTYNNIEALNQQYYTQCLQKLIEDIELLLDEGLGLGPGFGNPYGTEFDLDDLLRMDSKTLMDVVGMGVQRGIYAPDEARFRFNLKPVPGGRHPYLQVQNYSLEALARRDEASSPATPGLPSREPGVPEETPSDGTSADDTDGDGGAAARALLVQDWLRRSQAHYVRPDS